jgi:hypothetical protein
MITNEYFYSILDKICLLKNDKFYIINNDAFKKMKFLDLYQEFIDNLKPFYKASKQHYLTRPPKYTGFLTLLRHVCKSNELIYSSKIKYDKSQYEIIYYVYKK